MRRRPEDALRLIGQMGIGTGGHLKLQQDVALNGLLGIKLYMGEEREREREGSRTKEEEFAQENE